MATPMRSQITSCQDATPCLVSQSSLPIPAVKATGPATHQGAMMPHRTAIRAQVSMCSSPSRLTQDQIRLTAPGIPVRRR